MAKKENPVEEPIMDENKDAKAEEAVEAADAEIVEEVTPSELDQTKQELADLKDRYMRVLAEYDNFRKRTEKEKAQTYDRAIKDTVEKFLTVADTMEMALAHQNCSADDLRKGVELIQKNLLDTLQKLGVETVGEVGDDFNPELHDAVQHVENPELGENKISAVYRRGYKINDMIIRHASVVVAN